MTDESIERIETVQQSETPKEGAVSDNNNRPDDFDGLSNRDAIKKAIEVHKERDADNKEPAKTSQEPTKEEVKQELAEDLEPPSGFNKLEKEAWNKKDLPSIMKAYRRLETERVKEVTRAQSAERQARQEAKQWLDLNPVAKPYVEAREKEGVTFHQAIKEALELTSALRNANPAEVREALKNAKINLDESGQPEKKVVDPHLQEEITAIKSYIESQEISKLANAYDQVFQKLGSLKTRTGENAYPEFNLPGDEIKDLAQAIGSSTKDPAFIAGVRRRIPDADFETIVLEAYKYHGGKVSGQPAEVSQQNNKHIEKARRAAASSPAKQVSRNDKSSLIGKLSNSAAIKQALIDHRGN